MMENLEPGVSTVELPEAQPVRYVTYTDDGTLDGCYLQVPPEEHAARMIAITEDQAAGWVNYRATDTRDGVEMAPPSPPPAPIVPEEVSAGQAREALYNAGILVRVQPAIDAIPDADMRWRAQNAWDFRPTVQRHSPFVAMMAGALELADNDLDALFIAASKL